MCGIAGFVSQFPVEFNGRLTSAVNALEHRGPDDCGFMCWLEGGELAVRGSASDKLARVGFAHRRLSIIDLSTRGRQPMLDKSLRYALTFNGEIYNFKELRVPLESAGVVFESDTDTEVLLQLLIREGPSCIPRLRGMFAFAFFSLDTNSVVFARDPFGIKPLYLCRTEGSLCFSSELNSLRLLKGGSAGPLNPQVVYNYLRFGTGDDGIKTFHLEIEQLEPGHFLKVNVDSPCVAKSVRYWGIAIQEPIRISFADAVSELRDRFLRSVALHMRSDVRIGAALSGGIDSSAIVACMRKLEPDAEIQTFSYTPRGFTLNEEKWAAQQASRVGAVQNFVDFSADELTADLDSLLYSQGEPFGSTSIYAQYRIFRAARERGVKVMLDGQGGDEIFAGYPVYFAARLAAMVRERRFGDLLRLWRRRRIAGGGHLRAWLQATEHLLPERIVQCGRRFVGKEFFPEWMNRETFELAGVTSGRLESRLDERGIRGILAETLTRTIIPQLLHYEDRNSMCWSIESRVPFLNVDVVDFALSLPEHYLLSDSGVTKWVFREAMRGLVPDEILNRTDKVGFQTPGNSVLTGAADWVDSILDSVPDRALEYVNLKGLKRLWSRSHSPRYREDHSLWKALCFVRWIQLN